MIVLGIDPGLVSTGFALIKPNNRNYSAIRIGEIKTHSRSAMPDRLGKIFSNVSSLIGEYGPDEVAVEELFYAKNPKVALMMGHARGAALVAAAEHHVPVAEYSPREIKLAITGFGNASKEQVKRMVIARLSIDPASIGYDESDALAVAICHCQRSH